MNIESVSQEIHIKDYVDILRRRRDIALIFFATLVLVVTIGSFIMRPVYRATVMLLVDSESPNVLTTTGMVELQSQNYFSYKEYYQSQAEILSSYGLAKKVFEEYSLGNLPEYRRAKEPVKKFLKTVKVEPVRDTRLLKLNVDDKNPELAAKIANRMAELYVMRNLYYISKSELLNLLKNEYLKLVSKTSEYAKIYKDGHPEMIKVKKEMDELIDRIDQEKKSVCDYGNIEDYLKAGSNHPLAGFKANNVSIQDPAEKPVVPIRPKKSLNILIAIILGALGGAGLAFFFEYLDDNVKTLEDVEKVADWPFLGSIHDIDGNKTLKEFEKDMLVNLMPRDPAAEVYRSIRTRVLFSTTEEHPIRSVVVTSPGPQEGKTTTLCNLGIAMAQNQKRVLLVDSDMRKPRLHEIFKKDSGVGLSNFLSGQASLKDVIQETEVKNLYLVTGGVIPPDPSELLASNKTKEFIAKAREDFDFILFDSPPVTMLTDAVIISKMVDGTIIVIESGKTSRRILARIHRLFEDTKSRVIGMLLNKVSLNAANQYYYSYYYGKPK